MRPVLSLVLAGLLLFALSLVAVGCDTNSRAPSAPVLAPSNEFAPARTLVSSDVTTNESGQRVLTETWRDGVNLVKVIYICDYPMGYYGPPAPGHCYEDGTGCTGYPGGPEPPAAGRFVPLAGDPTAED